MAVQGSIRRGVVRPLLLLISAGLVGLTTLLPGKAPPQYTIRVTFGLKDEDPADWGATLKVVDGEVDSLTGWRFDENDKFEGTTGWRAQTHSYPNPRRRRANRAASPPADGPPWPNGVTLVVRGKHPTVGIHFDQGDISFRPAELAVGEPSFFLRDQVCVQRLPEAARLRAPATGSSEGARQDDYPALCIDPRDGTQYLAWICYQQRADRVLLVHRTAAEEPWSEPLEVADAGDHFRVALAQTSTGSLWIVWSSQRDGKWGLYGRSYRDGRLGPELRLSDSAGPSIWHRMIADSRGRVWLVWQAFQNGKANIHARCADDAGWHEPIRVTDGPTNHWDPAVAADPTEDRIWIGWDGYETGSYQVAVRALRGGTQPDLGPILQPAPSDSFEAHINLACDRRGILWAAWDESGPQWGKDFGHFYPDTGGTRLYAGRTIRIRCLVNGQWQAPAADLARFLPAEMQRYHELPQLQPDAAGHMWLVFRHRTAKRQRPDGWATQGRWEAYATACVGDAWLYPTELPFSAGRNDMRAASALGADGAAWFTYASDNRHWLPPNMPPRNLSVAVARLQSHRKAASPNFEPPIVSREPRNHRPLVHPRESQQVARARSSSVTVGGKSLHLFRGDLHRHTDISIDGMGDGSLMDLYRYGLDAAALDFILVSDHNMGQNNEYSWWRTQKSNDLYHVPGFFVPLYGYERSVPYPNGHRNIIWTERGYRTLPLPFAQSRKQMAEDTAKVYAYLRQTDGICTSHTTASQQGTDWEEHDDALEPIVEIFQGFASSYEAPGAPRAINSEMIQIHGPFRPAGFVSNALRTKGYRLGFQASSDHVSTHVGYTCVWAESLTRQSLVSAMLKRHTYGATDNIVLDVRMGSAIMGDQVQINQPALDVKVLGTGPIEEVDILKDSEVVHAERPSGANDQMAFHWADPQPPHGQTKAYYYVRVRQADGQMAWASPIWVRAQD